MKKIISLSTAICMLICILLISPVYAAETIYCDEDFNDVTLNLVAGNENNTAVFKDLTGWTLVKLDGEAKIKTVVATEVDPSWTGRGKILKLEGTPIGDPIDAKLLFSIPFDGYTYDQDLFTIEWDVFVPAENTGVTYSMFMPGPYDAWGLSSGKLTANGYTQRSADHIDTDNIGLIGQISSGQAAGNWHKIKFVVDGRNKDRTFYERTNTRTLYVEHKNIGTGATYTNYYPIGNIFNKDLPIGGNPSAATIGDFSGTIYIDNIKVYKTNKLFIKSFADEGKKLSVSTPHIDVEMSTSVDSTSLSTITANRGSISASLLEDGKTIRVAFLQELEYLTNYEIDFAGIETADGQTFGGTQTKISFVTESYPPLTLRDTTVYKQNTLLDLENDEIEADGSLYTFVSKVVNSAATDCRALVIYAVYDNAGKLVDTVCISKVVGASNNDKIGAGISIGSSVAGGKIVNYLWNSIDNMQPYHKAPSFIIAE